MPANTVKVDRTTLFGNPFTVDQHGHSGAIRMFELWLDWKLPPGSFPDQVTAMLMTKRQMVLERLPTLRRKNRTCWCPEPEPGERDVCHAAVLLERANSGCK
jgi:Domain of unknown function (DUF4326)